MVIVLVIGPKVRGFKPAEGDGFLSATSFGVEVKPSVPCRDILRQIKDPC
jgi:hypothetical protein